MELLWLAVSTIAIGVFGCVAWFWGSNWLLDRIYPPRGAQAGDNIRRANQIRPWASRASEPGRTAMRVLMISPFVVMRPR